MQTRVVDQPAFILHRKDWRNSSLILDLLTRDYGRVKVLAKGGKNSRNKSLYQPFIKLVLGWVGRHQLKTLVTIEGESREVSESLYLPLLYVNEIIGSFLPEFEANSEIFELYDKLLHQINLGSVEQYLREFERRAMLVFGYLPDLQVDCQQGKPIHSDGYYQFVANQGLLPCDSEDSNAIRGETIIFWNQNDYSQDKVLPTAKSIMRSIIDFNLQGKKLKSREIYLHMKHWV